MQIQWSEAAMAAWKSYVDEWPEMIGLKLHYEADGCGCALSGVVRLQPLTNVEISAKSDWHNGSTSSVPVYYEPRFEIFFEEHLFLHYTPERKCFKLSGKGQIYNPCMKLT